MEQKPRLEFILYDLTLIHQNKSRCNQLSKIFSVHCETMPTCCSKLRFCGKIEREEDSFNNGLAICQYVLGLVLCHIVWFYFENLCKSRFLTFPVGFYIPMIFSNYNSNCFDLLGQRKFLEHVKKAFLFKNCANLSLFKSIVVVISKKF